MIKERRGGFTLIELLVVIVIIALLASMVILNVSKSRIQARDARRAADVKSLKTALEMFYQKNQRYPTCSDFSFTPGDITDTGNSDICNGNIPSGRAGAVAVYYLKTPLAPYLASIPQDPTSGSRDTVNYQYISSTTTDAYAIRIQFENSDYTNNQCMTGVNIDMNPNPPGPCWFNYTDVCPIVDNPQTPLCNF